MTIEEQLGTRLKEAMRAKRTEELDVLRMVKSQAQTARTAPGFDGATDDAFWLDAIARYVKQQRKAREEFEKGGEAGAEQVRKLTYEIEYLSAFLPKQRSEEDVRAFVKQAIAEVGAVGPKMVGRVVGVVMKGHRDEVDAEVVKRVATEELG